MDDPFEWLKFNPVDRGRVCPHGNGLNCECLAPEYEGLFVIEWVQTDGKHRPIICRVKHAHDGGMRELLHPKTREVIGSCGVHWFNANAKTFMQWYDDYSPPDLG